MKLTKTEALLLTLILTAAEAVQLNVTMSKQAHAGLSIAIVIFVGLHVVPGTPALIRSKLPAEAITIVSSLLGGVLILQQAFSIGAFWHTVIGIAAVIAAAYGIAPATAPLVKAKHK